MLHLRHATPGMRHAAGFESWLEAHHVSRAMMWAVLMILVSLFLLAGIMMIIGWGVNQSATFSLGSGALVAQSLVTFLVVFGLVVVFGGWFIGQIAAQAFVALVALPFFFSSVYESRRPHLRKDVRPRYPDKYAPPAEA